MAEEKKPAGGKPVAPAPKKNDPFAEVVEILVVAMVIIYLLNGFINLFSNNHFVSSLWSSIFPRAITDISQAKDLSELANPIGAKVLNKNDTSVYGEPGGSVIATEPKGAKGTVIKGPQYFDGEPYYFVEYADGTKGWVKQSDLGYDPAEQPAPLSEKGIWLSHTKPVATLADPVGATVVAMGDIAVYDSPGGKKIGTQSLGTHGKITQGPVEIDGEKYYFVKFDNGESGWVREEDIGVLTSEPTIAEKILMRFYSTGIFFKILSVLISLFLIYMAGYMIYHLTKIREAEHLLFYPTAIKEATGEPEVNPKWRKVLAHIESTSESDWKLAIIESDIMLDDILTKLHLPGDTMGEKMKAVEKSDFSTIDNAWEAHKIRNQIAHEGSEFVLTQHEARRVIALYQSIFEEFQIL